MKEDIQKVRNLSEEQLGEALYKIGLSMGWSESKAGGLKQNAPKIRQLLRNTSDEGLEKILGSMGKDAKTVLDQMKGDE